MVNICNAADGYLLSGICIRQNGLIFKVDFFWTDDPERALLFDKDEGLDTISFIYNVLSSSSRLVLVPAEDEDEEEG